MSKQEMKRGAGFLMPISSLPSPYGIGTMGKEAYTFVDFLKKSGCRYWQVLPVGPTSYGDSPYQSFSAFAGNPYFIDLDVLIEEGLLTKKEVESVDFGSNPSDVDYAAIYNGRFGLLRKAFKKSAYKSSDEYAAFLKEHEFWISDYALYMAIKVSAFDNHEWQSWDEPIRMHEPAAVAEYAAKYAEDIEFWKFCQFKFDEQWKKLKKYANENDIQIIGDIPLYVSMDSADVWSKSELFELDEKRREINIAGVPPDLFSATGQRWGNPLYRWDYMENDWFWWWRERMHFASLKYDVIRIDHFIGIVNYYSIPATCPTAMEGEWKPGPGKRLMDMIASVIGDSKLIAEDLGVLTPNVQAVIDECGYPGMKVLEFGMDMDPTNPYLPHNYTTDNVIAYIGTHDNETLEGFLKTLDKSKKDAVMKYFGIKRAQDIRTALIKVVYGLNSNVAIFQMQDLLGLGNEARTNHPSTIGGNWRWRMTKEQYAQLDSAYYKELAVMFNRYADPKEEAEEK